LSPALTSEYISPGLYFAANQIPSDRGVFG
jgi:hypothetical protein